MKRLTTMLLLLVIVATANAQITAFDLVIGKKYKSFDFYVYAKKQGFVKAPEPPGGNMYANDFVSEKGYLVPGTNVMVYKYLSQGQYVFVDYSTYSKDEYTVLLNDFILNWDYTKQGDDVTTGNVTTAKYRNKDYKELKVTITTTVSNGVEYSQYALRLQ